MKMILRFSILILFGLSAACAPVSGVVSTGQVGGPAAWIDAPLDNSSLPLAEYQVVSHASDPAGISSFELSVDGQVLHTDTPDEAGATIAHIQQPWLPAAPGVYLLALRAANKDGVYGPYAFAHVVVGAATQTPTPTLTPTPTATITPTPTPSTINAVGLQNTNCHDGPGNAYKNDGTLLKGQSVEIQGLSEDGQWVRVQHPNFDRGDCWLYIPLIEIIGDLDGLPVLPAPPLPRATDAPTRLPTATATRRGAH